MPEETYVYIRENRQGVVHPTNHKISFIMSLGKLQPNGTNITPWTRAANKINPAQGRCGRESPSEKVHSSYVLLSDQLSRTKINSCRPPRPLWQSQSCRNCKCDFLGQIGRCPLDAMDGQRNRNRMCLFDMVRLTELQHAKKGRAAPKFKIACQTSPRTASK